MDYISWKNIFAVRLEYASQLSNQLGLGVSYHLFNKAVKEDSVYAASGAVHSAAQDATKTAIGSEVDLTLGYQLASNLNITAGYSQFFPGDAFVNDQTSSWAYVMTQAKF